MTRLAALAVLTGAALLASPAAASAQFMPFGAQFRFAGPTGMPMIVPSTNPFFYVPKYQYNFGAQYTGPTLFGFTSIGYRKTAFGVTSPAAYAYQAYQMSLPYAQTGSYITGSPSTRADFVLAAQRNLAKAQREASMPGARSTITSQGDYEKGTMVMPPPDMGPLPPESIRIALAPTDRALITSGEALNGLLKEIIRVEATGAKGPSAYVPPLMLDDIRFGGSPAGDLLNLARQAGNLNFPEAFENAALATQRVNLEKAFATAVVVVQSGKAPDAGKIAALEMSFDRLNEAAGSVIKNLPFEEATAARRFLNSMARAIQALKSGAASGLIDPKWAAEGLTVADLTKHMAKHKLLFGTAPRGAEEAYSTMHQNLATYLFVLNQSKK